MALEFGANGFITKPVREEEIFEAIAKVISVSYLYAGESEKLDLKSEETHEEALQFTHLSTDLRDSLRDAVQNGDIDAMTSSISRIQKFDAVLGAQLALMVDQFEYDKLLAFLEH